ncbi:helix-turn-helix domain-containing protein [Rhizobium tropici]|uniref:Transcriptional regulator with XRE-family HTH domain n=1 Tax=Rhizobium tropici TaxID=398 RepID=A0ABR6R8J5_RHITR|nr:helix-turn-helix transcriptional regulator [Rhizobium tropici]MBB4245238.1 transcriptional regulator with XRE-family HTH domain [Rhizobium tropici]MBB6495512.1 transcriptional regulator with XRE-family HTH domain [Rhizobium tropici]
MSTLLNPPASNEAITPAQCRAARALLAWSQQELASRARVATSTVADFERGHRNPIQQNAEAIRGVLEAEGIAFRAGGAVIGPTLPAFADRKDAGLPIRWVDATDLSQWAERRDGQGSLPTLLAKLARANRPILLRFPSDEGVQHAGWDGVTEASEASEYIPLGVTGWEIGTQRDRIASKADDDYKKRSENPLGLIPAELTFIFVTPRHWPQKEMWAQKKRAENIWKDVRAYDGDNLVHWIELYPAVGLWLAIALGKRPAGALDLREYWLEWALATQWQLPSELVLCDRDESATRILRWLRGPSSVLAVKGESPAEVSGFVYAAINQLPANLAEYYLCRSLVVANSETARLIGDSATPLVIVVLDPEPGLAQALAKKGHHVLAAYGQDASSSGDAIVLERPARENIKIVLEGVGVPSEMAGRMARDSSRSLGILRRLMPSSPGRVPAWAKGLPSQSLIAALLAGGWDESSEGDKSVLSRLADMPYEPFAASLAGLAGNFDSPLRKVGSVWKIASPRDAWGLLAADISPSHMERFAAVALDVLSAADPRYEMPAEERWYASVRGVHPEFSKNLRNGVGEVLIILALFGKLASSVPSAELQPDLIIQRLLSGADRQRWWSLSRDFQLLAEASPSSFLSALDDALGQDDSPVAVLFGHDTSPLFGAEHLSTLLWALETLAWSPDYLGRAASILGALDELDPGGRYTNRPGSSLRTTFLLWAPQTHATLEQRLRVLDRLRARFPKAAWKLLLGILPTEHDSFSPTPAPLWRDFSTPTSEIVTFELIERGALAITDRLLADASADISRWVALLDRWGNLGARREEALNKLKALVPFIADDVGRNALRSKLRAILHSHRSFRDAAWALPEEELAPFEEIYNAITPVDLIAEISWLFDTSVALPNPIGTRWHEDTQRQLQGERRSVVEAILTNMGLDGLFALANAVQEKGYLGQAIAEAEVGNPRRGHEIIVRALTREGVVGLGVARGMIITMYPMQADQWVTDLVDEMQQIGAKQESLLAILLALPPSSRAWSLLRELGANFEEQYWKRVPILWINGEREDTEFAVSKLMDVGRARHVVHLVGLRLHTGLTFGSDLLVRLLIEAALQPAEFDADHNDTTMFQHYVAEILSVLDNRDDVPATEMLKLEWIYLPVLEYSQRPAKLIIRELASNPQLFIDVICAIYKPSEDSRVVEETVANQEQVTNRARQASNLLRLWNVVPGTRPDGTIDLAILEDWVQRARQLAKSAGREDISDQKIGEVLACAPSGQDGIWPTEAVRELIESVRNKNIEIGLMIGRRNLRGVTTRLPRDGGAQEHDLARTFSEWSRATALEWPRTSAVLEKIATSYDYEARSHDNDAEKLDW